MAKVYRLHNQIKHYEWGSTQLIPQFLGIENYNHLSDVPCAELWMGTHSGAPSKAELVTGESGEKLKELTEISGELPFLFKLLAVEKPLSIQAHPNKEQAVRGFNHEQEANLDLKAPRRNYKDANHKPEILCAISPFTLMAGFREFNEIRKSLEEFSAFLPPLKETISPLFRSLNTDSLAVFFRILFSISQLEREYLTNLISEIDIKENTEAISQQQWKLMKNFASQYPGDPAILSPLYLNLLTLQPWQAINVPAGVLHAYISGFGVELMSNSDNVLRGGLTPKYVDIPGLMSVVNFAPYYPPVYFPDSSSWFCYQALCEDFSLAVMRSNGGEVVFPEKEPAVCIVIEGELSIDGILFKKGESFFIPKQDAASLSFKGNFSLFAARQGDCTAGIS